jgi:hypothetical protein
MTTLRAIVITATITMLLSVFLQAQEKQIKRSELPPAVEKAVVGQSHGATIHGFSQERENGQTFYEAELIVNGHSKDILMDPNGKIVEVEEHIPIESLPSAVRDGLLAKAGKGKLVRVETLTKNNKLVAYEATVLTNGKKSEIQVVPTGSF